ncbi:plasmid partition protein ParG [Providencia rettgeri]|uniref:plasmid partition protein ParG n=1 Tax=Providencia TaxID=586 RepID=UPI001419B187|nr:MULTISPECIES: plasmid partition protein ParG [Providencia]EIU7559213.1 DNA partition complex ParG [Providencia rettgeri]EJD6411679.1 DNA partition complex ParG [Providencia rettgeri]EJD6615532.1 DNA partition complex ParG [Providencia rettgeri]ELL9151371.1 DNA partition complex ParG [Providencia rettgeri]ELR5241487.1 DNA partition complex ParG [Providencia rettgeri]
MALKKVESNTNKMKFGEHRDLDSILTKKGKTKRINVDLDEDVQTRFKAACAKQNTTIKDVISQFVDDWLRENE